MQQQEPGQEERGVADVLLLGLLGRGQAAARIVQVGLVHPEPVLRDPRHGQVKVVAVLPDRRAPVEHRAGRRQRGQGLLRLVFGAVLAGPAVHHQLQPLLDGGRVHLLRVPAEQLLGGVVGGPGRLEVVIGHLQPPQPGQQVRPAERVTGGDGAQGGLERLPGLAAPPGAPEHVGQLGLQFHRGRALARDLQSGAEGGDGLVVGEGHGGVVARHLVIPQRPVRLPGGGEVPAEDGGYLVRSALCCRLERPRGAAMQEPAFGAQQPVVGRLLDQGVPEAVDGLAPPGQLVQQVPGAQFVQGGAQRLAGGAHRGQQGQRELGAEHGRGPDSVAGRRAEPVHPGPDQALQRLGQLRARGAAEPPGALLAHQGPGLQQRAQSLLQEQRIAVGTGQHGVQDLPAGAVPHQGPGQLLLVRPGQRLERQPAGVEAVQRRGGLGPAGGQDQQPAARGQPGQVEGEAERGRVGPVQVLQDQDGRARGHQA